MADEDNKTDNQDNPPADPPKDGDTPPADPPEDKSEKKEDKPAFQDDGADPDGGTPPTKPDDNDDKDDDDDLLEEEEKRINKVVQKNLAPFQDTYHKQAVESQLKDILATNPEYKPYEARIKRWVTHPNRANMIKQGLPVGAVVAEALQPYMQSIVAEKVKNADDKAAQTRSDGSTQRPTESKGMPDFSKMSAKEIENVAELVKRGAYNPK